MGGDSAGGKSTDHLFLGCWPITPRQIPKEQASGSGGLTRVGGLGCCGGSGPRRPERPTRPSGALRRVGACVGTAKGEAGPTGALSRCPLRQAPSPLTAEPPSTPGAGVCCPGSPGWSVFFFHTNTGTHEDVQPTVNKELFLPPHCFLAPCPSSQAKGHLSPPSSQPPRLRGLPDHHRLCPARRPQGSHQLPLGGSLGPSLQGGA